MWMMAFCLKDCAILYQSSPTDSSQLMFERQTDYSGQAEKDKEGSAETQDCQEMSGKKASEREPYTGV